MRLAIAFVVLPAFPAGAAIQTCYLDQMVAEAVIVIQVVDQEVSEPDDQGNCTLVATVARNFRGDKEPGTRISTTFACSAYRPPDENGVIVVEPGGTTYHDAEAVAEAGAIEIHAAAEGGPAGYGHGLLTLDAPTDAPAFPFEAINDC